MSDGGRQPAMLIVIRRTMEPVGPLTLARWQARAIIGTDRPTKAFRTAPKPCWAKRAWQLAASSAIVLTGGGKLSEPKKCARGLPMHRADRGHHSDHPDALAGLTHIRRDVIEHITTAAAKASKSRSTCWQSE